MEEQAATIKQVNFIKSLNPDITDKELSELNKFSASVLIRKLCKERQSGKPAPKVENMQQTAAIEEYFKYIDEIEPNDSKYSMNDFYKKECSNVWQIEDGFIIFEKPRIETHFCFGYGYCGVSTEEDYERASNNAHIAETDNDYFLRENLEELNNQIDQVAYAIARQENNEQEQEKLHKESLNKRVYFNGQSLYLCKLKDNTSYHWRSFKIYFVDSYKIKNDNYYDNINFRELTLEEMKEYKKLLENEKAKFNKRLQTYLKKYGLSKIRSWTYLSD